MSIKQEVRLNRETDLLKLFAMIIMLIDHIGVVFFPNLTTLRVIGRLSFPLFCYCLAAGCCYSRSMGKYALRLLLAALVSQPLYVIVLKHVSPAMAALDFSTAPMKAALQWYLLSLRTCNIMVALLLGQLTIWTIRAKKYALTACMTFLVLFLDSQGWITNSYGAKGVGLMVLFYLFIDQPVASFVWMAGYMTWWGLQGTGFTCLGVPCGMQIYAIMALPLVYLPLKRHVQVHRAVFYVFYPAHLALLLMLKHVL